MKCIHCKKKVNFVTGIKCSYCKKMCCFGHMLLESHNCAGMENYKKQKIMELSAKLHKEAEVTKCSKKIEI